MAYYHVDIAYRFKKRRAGVCIGMVVKAFGPDEAEEFARESVLKGYPHRQFAYSDIREATADEIKFGAVNEHEPA